MWLPGICSQSRSLVPSPVSKVQGKQLTLRRPKRAQPRVENPRETVGERALKGLETYHKSQRLKKYSKFRKASGQEMSDQIDTLNWSTEPKKA